MGALHMIAADPFSIHMEAVARKLLGDPNPQLSCATELRFGQHGSMSVDLERGVWQDHESKVGGGVVDLLEREKKLSGREAVEWMQREIGAVFEDRRSEAKAKLVKTYDYVDENGEVLFQVCRFDPKDFRQRKPDPTAPGGWNWSVRGVRQVPYRLHELTEALAMDRTIYIAEGEKDVDALAVLGIPATCNAGGAGKWPEGLAEHFKGADVVILPDNDQAGRNHASVVGSALAGVAKRVRILDIPGLGPKGDPADWAAMGGDAAWLDEMVAGLAKDWRPVAPESRFGAIAWNDVDSVELRHDYLVEDLIFAGDHGMFYGASGSGKSFLAVDMGASIARGVPFLGKKTRKGSVIYQAGEGGKGLVRRLRAYREHHHCKGESVPFVLLPTRVDLFGRDGDEEAFIEECMLWKASLPDPLGAIFIDTFSTASPGANENASEDVSRLIKAGENISQATGAALFWVHHKNAAGDRERGHTSLRANIDTAIEVIKDEETKLRTMRLAKMKDGEDGLKLGFELQSVTVGTYDDGKPITSCVVVPAQVQESRTSKRFRLSPGQAKFLKILDDAITHRGAIMPVTGRVREAMYGAAWGDFREMYVAIGGQGKDPTAIRTALSRDGDALYSGGHIDREGDYLWITQRGMEMLK